MVRLDGFDFRKSTRKHKKYDVYRGGKYLTSFGDARYEHYHDRIGIWSHKDHRDPERRRLYRIRHARDHLSDRTSAGFFSWFYLW